MENKLDLFDIQPINFKDIDQAITDGINDLNLTVKDRRVPVYFSPSERWSVVNTVIQSSQGTTVVPVDWREKNGQLIFPLIVIRRIDVEAPPEKYIFKKLEGYSDILVGAVPATDQRTKRRMDPKFQNQVYDLLFVEYPDWINANFEVSLFTSFNNYIYYLKQEFIKRFSNFSVVTQKGHEFNTTLQSISNESNLDDLVNDERVFKYSFQYMVQSYLMDKSTYKVKRNFDTILTNEFVYEKGNRETLDQFIQRTSQATNTNARPVWMQTTKTYDSQFDPASVIILPSTGTEELTMYKNTFTVTAYTGSFIYYVNGGSAVTNNENFRLFLNGVHYNKTEDYSLNASNGQITWLNTLVPVETGDTVVTYYQ